MRTPQIMDNYRCVTDEGYQNLMAFFHKQSGQKQANESSASHYKDFLGTRCCNTKCALRLA